MNPSARVRHHRGWSVVLIPLLLAGLVFSTPSPAAAAGPLGVVLLHGKNGAPDSEEMLPLSYALIQAGFLVETPEMPWSWIRLYDASFQEAMTEIESACLRLRTRGAGGLAVAGDGLGANAALAYAVSHPGLVGVAALSPSHSPELPSFREPMASEVRRARELIAQGQGEIPATFDDQDRLDPFRASAAPRVYLSYIDPNGLAVMPKNAARLPKGTALFWVISKDDLLYPRGQDYALALAPPNPRHRYLVVDTSPARAPVHAVDQLVAWLKSLGF